MSANPTPDIHIREPHRTDYRQWRELWDDYLAFYDVELDDMVSQATWDRVLDPASELFGFVATTESSLLGFCNCILHPGTWTGEPICYLEDLFVDPDARGKGIGAGIIDFLITKGREAGWSRLYWHTNVDNAAARALYDRYVSADDFVRYRIFL